MGLERRARQHVGHREQGYREPLGDGSAVGVVAVEQLEDACGLAERGAPVDDVADLDRVDEPDLAADGERVRGALHALVDDPADAQRRLVDGQ